MERIEKIKGIVVRSVNVGDYDKMLTVLTADRGVVSVSAKGVRSLKHKNAAATGLLSYGEFVVKAGREVYSLRECEIIESFYSLRMSVEGFALGAYFASLAAMVVQSGQEAEDELRLLLNSLYVVTKAPERARLLKCVFELRIAELCGIAPQMGECGCGRFGEYFDIERAEVFCAEHGSGIKISQSANRVMSYIIESDLKSALYFDTQKEVVDEIAPICEAFLRHHFGTMPKTLDYLHKVF